MKLYLMQHGQALSKDEDPEEGLSDEGRVMIENSAQGLKALGIQVDQFFCSPKKRSFETTAIIAEALGFHDELIEDARVKPMVEPEETMTLFKEKGRGEAIFLGGHLPSIQKITSYLLSQSDVGLEIRQGACLCIETTGFSKSEGKLLWYLLPEQLKQF